MEYSVNSYRKVAVKQRFSDLKKITEETTKYVSDGSMKVTDDFKLACNEVMAVLDNTKPEVKEEVPNNMFLFLAANEDVHFKNEIDHDKDLDSQNLSEKAIYLISIIYRSYLCPDKQALDEILMKKKKKKKRKKKICIIHKLGKKIICYLIKQEIKVKKQVIVLSLHHSGQMQIIKQ